MSMSPVLLALAAAVLFGASTPLAKLLLGSIDPWMLAGLLYLGSGIGLTIIRAITTRSEAALQQKDLPWLAGAILSGGVIGPVLLMFGLSRTPAATASLLLTLEGAATAGMAWFVFRENFDRRIAMGMGCILAGAAVLAWQGELTLQGLIGPLAIAGACLAWGLDNNLTRKVSLADPMQIALLKGLVAGPVSLILAIMHGASLPPIGPMSEAALLGFFGYGVSLVCFVLALRGLGSARTGGYFAVAPFIGAVIAIPLLNESLSVQLLVGAALTGLGVWLHLTEHHVHRHDHEPMAHSHRHQHDLHHRHEHEPGDPAGEPHSHLHSHVRLRHSHAHMPDSHHRHEH